MRKSIVLLGPKGCGKTTVGKIISKREGIDFVETDERFLAKYGRSVEDFLQEGKPKELRQKEAKLLGEISKEYLERDLVLALGNRTVAHEYEDILSKTLEGLKKISPNRIYLLPSPNLETSARMLSQRGQRTNLTDAAIEEATKILQARHPHYMKASNIQVYTGNMNQEEVVNYIIKLHRR